MVSKICTGIEDRGPHSISLGENKCPYCRITELEDELGVTKRKREQLRSLCKERKAQLEAVKDDNKQLRNALELFPEAVEQLDIITELQAQLEAVKPSVLTLLSLGLSALIHQTICALS